MQREPSFDVYLLMRPFREIVPELRLLVRPLQYIESRLAIGAEGFYSPKLDAALVAIRFDRAIAGRLGRKRLCALMASTGLPVIAPETLSFEHRCEFFLEHLTNYTTYVQLYNEPRESLLERTIIHLYEHRKQTERARVAQ